MKIIPLYHFSASWYEANKATHPQLFCYTDMLPFRFHRKAMVLVVSPGMEFPAGTPDHLRIRNTDVWVYRGKVNHFHMQDFGVYVPAGYDPNGFAVANSTRLGRGRKALKDLVEQCPFVDPAQQAYLLRTLVREGD